MTKRELDAEYKAELAVVDSRVASGEITPGFAVGLAFMLGIQYAEQLRTTTREPE